MPCLHAQGTYHRDDLVQDFKFNDNDRVRQAEGAIRHVLINAEFSVAQHSSIVTTRRVGSVDLPPGSRQFARRRCACSFSHSRSRLLVDILRTHFHTYYSSPRRSPLSLRKDPSRFSPLQYIEVFRRRGEPGGLLRGGFDPLPQRIISDRRALGSVTERPAVQGMTERPAEQRLISGRDGRFYCCGSASTSAVPAMSNAAVQQWLLHSHYVTFKPYEQVSRFIYQGNV
ncbi:hypothetical protein T05_14928 [Trichinella murrelli]|uniref:Uncharacterized protein n=1 Tax=Trichinella murrelli TaxID=144512 RepID=A0A0V0TA90_9BILA|nr:hypothetical protein T05_14928 [Trichinella murrelli]